MTTGRLIPSSSFSGGFVVVNESWSEPSLFDTSGLIEVSEPSVTALHIFTYWVSEIKSSARRKPVFSEKRRKLIEKALATYGAEACFLAIDGCKASPWHMGENPQGVKYNDIELIFRNEKNIERFIERAEDRVIGFLEEN